MAVQHGLHVLAAAAVAAGVLTGRWWYTRARRNSGHGASAARAPGAGHPPRPGPARVTSVWSVCTPPSSTWPAIKR